MSNIIAEVQKQDMSENLLHLLDANTFVEFRDYYLRFGMVKFEYRHTLNTGSKNTVEDYLRHTSITKNKYTEYAKILNTVLNNSLTSQGIEELQTQILKAQHDKSKTPYERVGHVLSFLKSLKKDNIKIIKHSEFRNILEHMLLDWTCRDIYSKPDISISESGIDKALVKLIHKKRDESKLEWKNIWSLKRSAHTYEAQDFDDELPEIYYEDRKIIRNKLRKDFNNEEILLTSRLFKYGYMYNKFSWSKFQEFIERQYILTSNEKSFDKTFFSEWLSGYNWSTKENKTKYENIVNEGIKKWLLMVEELTDEQIDYLFPIVTHKPFDKVVYKWDYTNKDLKNSLGDSRILNYDDIYKKITIKMLDKHPVLYMYKDFLIAFNKNTKMNSLTEDEINTHIYNKYPQLKMLNILFNMGDDVTRIANNWHAEQEQLDLILNPKITVCELPKFEDGIFELTS